MNDSQLCLLCDSKLEPVDGSYKCPVCEVEDDLALGSSQNTFCYEVPLTRWQRFLRWLFPYRHCEWPELPNPPPDADCIHVSSRTHFSFADRIRILLTGKVLTQVRISGEKSIGRYKVNSVSCVRAKWDLFE